VLTPGRTSSLLVAVALISVSALVGGCSAEGMLGVDPLSPDSLAALESREPGVDRGFIVLPLTTPDGFHQTVHPDYAVMPGWSPRRYLIATPYAFSATALENPSLYAQDPDFNWQPHGTNPIATPKAGGYLSDPDMVAVEEYNELWVYYRQANKRNTVWLIRSSNGYDWSAPKRVVSAPKQMVVSPSVIRRGRHDWLMYSVNAGKDGCTGNASFVELRRSRDGIHWSPPVEVGLRQDPFLIWHIEVQWIPSRQEFWAVYNVKNPGNCNTDLLFLATSPDGVNWATYPSPLLRAGVIPEFQDIVYRSTFAYNPRTDNIRFWFSGAHYEPHGYVWNTVYQKRSRAEVFASLAMVPNPKLTLRRGRDTPPLTNPP
jgi:hypothetical protein